MSNSRTETVHRYFRGSGEIAKLLHRMSFGTELIMVALAVQGLVSEEVLSRDWRPLAILSLAIIAAASRTIGLWVESFSNFCRQTALRAYALDREIELFFEIEAQVLPLTEFFAKRLPAKSIDDYYTPKQPPGEERLRELYANSAFHNWRLQRLHAYLTGTFGLSLLISGFVLTYALVVTPPGSWEHVTVLGGFYSVVLVFLALRALQRAAASAISAISMSRAVNALQTAPPNSEKLQEVILHFEVERARAPLIPTYLYRISRNRLQRKWRQLQAALDRSSPGRP